MEKTVFDCLDVQSHKLLFQHNGRRCFEYIVSERSKNRWSMYAYDEEKDARNEENHYAFFTATRLTEEKVTVSLWLLGELVVKELPLKELTFIEVL